MGKVLLRLSVVIQKEALVEDAKVLYFSGDKNEFLEFVNCYDFENIKKNFNDFENIKFNFAD